MVTAASLIPLATLAGSASVLLGSDGEVEHCLDQFYIYHSDTDIFVSRILSERKVDMKGRSTYDISDVHTR